MTARAPRRGPRAVLDAWNRVTGPFARFSMLGATLLFALLGLASASRPWDRGAGVVLAVLVVGCAYHLFAYLLNDVLDLPFDRNDPRRLDSPMVRGRVRPSTVLLVALAQLPVVFGITWLAAPTRAAFGTMALSLVLMSVYDAFGKRTAVPPLTDLSQGLAWGLLVLYGSVAVSRPTALTFWLAGFVVAWTMQVNGLHGALRDIDADYRSGARTTPIFLGGRPDPSGGRTYTRAVVAYWYALQAALTLTVALPLLIGDQGYGGWWRAAGVALVALFAGIGGATIAATVRAADHRPTMWSAGLVQLLVTSCLPFVLIAPLLDGRLLLALLLVYFGPWLTSRLMRAALAWGWRQGKETLWSLALSGSRRRAAP